MQRSVWEAALCLALCNPTSCTALIPRHSHRPTTHLSTPAASGELAQDLCLAQTMSKVEQGCACVFHLSWLLGSDRLGDAAGVTACCSHTWFLWEPWACQHCCGNCSPCLCSAARGSSRLSRQPPLTAYFFFFYMREMCTVYSQGIIVHSWNKLTLSPLCCLII